MCYQPPPPAVRLDYSRYISQPYPFIVTICYSLSLDLNSSLNLMFYQYSSFHWFHLLQKAELTCTIILWLAGRFAVQAKTTRSHTSGWREGDRNRWIAKLPSSRAGGAPTISSVRWRGMQVSLNGHSSRARASFLVRARVISLQAMPLLWLPRPHFIQAVSNVKWELFRSSHCHSNGGSHVYMVCCQGDTPCKSCNCSLLL